MPKQGKDENEETFDGLGAKYMEDTHTEFFECLGQVEEAQALWPKVKILIGWLQIASSFDLVFSVPWPQFIKDMGRFLYSLANIDLINAVAGVLCRARIGSIASFYFHMLFVPLIFVLTLGAYFVAKMWRRSANGNDNVLARIEKYLCGSEQKHYTEASMQTHAMNLLIFFIFLYYPRLGTVIFQLFKCQDIDGTSYLTSDRTITCWGGAHKVAVGWAVLFIFLYLAGIPLVFYVLLSLNRDAIENDRDNPELLARYGMLYEAYEPRFYYFGGCRLEFISFVAVLP